MNKIANEKIGIENLINKRVGGIIVTHANFKRGNEIAIQFGEEMNATIKYVTTVELDRDLYETAFVYRLK